MRYAATLVLYLFNSWAYLLLSPEYKIMYKNECAAWYFGSEAIFTAVLLFLACDAKGWIAKQLVYITSGFIFLRGILYILNYTLILTINARIRMIYLALYVLFIVIPTFISAYRHGHFKN